MIVLLVQAPRSFIDIFKKIFYMCPAIGKCHTAMKIHPVHFVLPQFYPIKTMSQSLCFDIEYWGSYGPFMFRKSKVEQNTNITLTFLIILYLRRTSLQLWDFDHVSTGREVASRTDYHHIGGPFCYWYCCIAFAYPWKKHYESIM